MGVHTGFVPPPAHELFSTVLTADRIVVTVLGGEEHVVVFVAQLVFYKPLKYIICKQNEIENIIHYCTKSR